MKTTGFLLLGLGVFLVLAGLSFLFADRIPLLGRLPGDIRLQGKYGSFFFPLTTCLLLSVALTVLANLVLRFWKNLDP